MMEDRWKSLEVWQLADVLAKHVYRATKDFPKEEIYGLTSQSRRAALSVPTSIVEGYSRRGDRELARFTDIALGSLAEVKYLLHFSNGFGYLNLGEFNLLTERASSLGGKLWKFYKRVSHDAKLESDGSRKRQRSEEAGRQAGEKAGKLECPDLAFLLLGLLACLPSSFLDPSLSSFAS